MTKVQSCSACLSGGGAGEERVESGHFQEERGNQEGLVVVARRTPTAVHEERMKGRGERISTSGMDRLSESPCGQLGKDVPELQPHLHGGQLCPVSRSLCPPKEAKDMPGKESTRVCEKTASSYVNRNNEQ